MMQSCYETMYMKKNIFLDSMAIYHVKIYLIKTVCCNIMCVVETLFLKKVFKLPNCIINKFQFWILGISPLFFSMFMCCIYLFWLIPPERTPYRDVYTKTRLCIISFSSIYNGALPIFTSVIVTRQKPIDYLSSISQSIKG